MCILGYTGRRNLNTFKNTFKAILCAVLNRVEGSRENSTHCRVRYYCNLDWTPGNNLLSINEVEYVFLKFNFLSYINPKIKFFNLHLFLVKLKNFAIYT